MIYTVYAGNVGKVFQGNNPVKANEVYGSYVRDSKNGYGRIAGESIVMFEDGEVKREYIGYRDLDQN